MLGNLLKGANLRKSKKDKLGRIEKVEWIPPLLKFKIERHGGFVIGSKRAELISWVIDTESLKAESGRCGIRQLEKNAPKMNIKLIADKLSMLILNLEKDEWISWRKDGSVILNIAKIIPDDEHSFKQTISQRRKRLRTILEPILVGKGWTVIRQNVYMPPK